MKPRFIAHALMHPTHDIFRDSAARRPLESRTFSGGFFHSLLSNPGNFATLAVAIYSLCLPAVVQAGSTETGAAKTGSANVPKLAAANHAVSNATPQFEAVPEPQTWVIAFAGLGTLIAMQRFRRTRDTKRP